MPADRAEAQGGPEIQITIGRIEVRTEQPVAPPASRRRPRPEPLLSLDTYLEEMAGGGR